MLIYILIIINCVIILENHLLDKWIKLSNKIKTTLFKTRLFEKWTASHLAAFVEGKENQ